MQSIEAKTDGGSVGMLLPDFTKLVEQEGPSVVNIQATKNAPAASARNDGGMDLSQFPDNDPFYEFFKRLVPNMPEVPQQDDEQGLARGDDSSLSAQVSHTTRLIHRVEPVVHHARRLRGRSVSGHYNVRPVRGIADVVADLSQYLHGFVAVNFGHNNFLAGPCPGGGLGGGVMAMCYILRKAIFHARSETKWQDRKALRIFIKKWMQRQKLDFTHRVD